MSERDAPDSLYRSQINTWWGRQKGDPPPHTFSHQTNFGTLTLEPCYPGGILQCEFTFNGVSIANFTTPIQAADAIAAGQFDEDMGFAGKDAGIPSALQDWGRW